MNRTINVDTKGINYFGRWDFGRAGVARTGWGATYIRMRFTGSSIRVKIADAADNWWQYSIDGAAFKKIAPAARATSAGAIVTIILGEDLGAGEHDLFLFRRTEGGLGISEIHGFELDTTGRIIEHDFSKNRRIEFVGNSIVCGFRNAGADWDDEDSYMAFSVHLARLLDADWSTVSISGIGVVHNYDEPWPPYMPHLQDYYPQTHKCETGLKWDFSRWQPDVIIIATGTNDFTDANRKPDAAEFKSGYAELIKVIRDNNPCAQIICSEPIPGWAGPLCREWIKELVAELKFDGDERISYLSFNEPKALLQDEHYVGDGTHPNILGGAVLAGYLKDKVAEIAGWK